MIDTDSVKVTHYLAMWDMLGLECIFDMSEFSQEHQLWEKKKIWQTLKEEMMHDIEPRIPIQSMILRARYNSQRAYEIYEFNSTLSESEIRKIFDDNPQIIVDWIRENGYKVYSDYVKQDKKMIV